MESALPLLLFLLFLFGSMLLILATGCAARLSEAFQDESTEAPSQPAPAPGLFGGPSTTGPSEPDDIAVLSSVESYLRTEERLVEEFVLEPSADRLYRRSELPPVPHDSFFESVEHFLATEQSQAEDFVANPSLDSLFGHFGFRALSA